MSIDLPPPDRLGAGASPPLSVRTRRRRALLAVLLVLSALADAAPFRLISGTVDSGGAHAQGSRFAVEGTVGQPDTGLSVGNRFRVDGGFWPTTTRSAPPADPIFRNSFED